MDKKHSEKFKEIAKKIKYYREQKGLSQEKLAGMVSISVSYLSKIEAPNCDKTFSLYVLFDIAQALEVPVGKLLE